MTETEKWDIALKAKNKMGNTGIYKSTTAPCESCYKMAALADGECQECEENAYTSDDRIMWYEGCI